MKATQYTELFANIKSSFVSFFAILMFVALGVGVFTGLYWSAPALKQASNQVFDDQNLYHFSVSYPYGFTADDMDDVLALDVIDNAALSRETYETYTNDDDRYSIKLQTLTDGVNEPIIIEGELPTAADEIALKHDTAQNPGLSVGDTITFDSNGADDNDGMTNLNGNTYTITALVESPEYLAHDTSSLGVNPSKGTSLDGVGWLVDDAFDGSAFRDGYPTLYVTSNDLNGLDTFSDAYNSRADEIENSLSDLGGRLSQDRLDQLKSDSQSQIDEGREALENGQQQVDAGRAQLDVMRAQMGLGDREITDAELAANPALQQIVDQEAQLDETQSELDDQRKQLDDSQEAVDSMKSVDWSISPREYNGGVAMVKTTTSMTDNLSFSMASLFVIVGLLVTYSTVSRLAHEQITQIGTKKALGLRNREITVSFLLYAAFAVIAGVIVGVIAAVFLVQGILISAIGARFILGTYAPYIGVDLMFIAAAVELILVLLAAWFACRNILREQAVELLKGEKPPEGKTRFYERWAVWSRLPLYTQTIVNNCINDTRRVVSTIIGVAGVTALVVTAVTLNNDIENSFNRQYSDVYNYDTVVAFNPDTADAQSSIEDALKDDGLDPVVVYRKTTPCELPDETMGTAEVIVPQSLEDFSKVCTLVPTVASSSIDSLVSHSTPDLLSQEGAWISQAFHDNEGAQTEDTITFIDANGEDREVPILGFFEYYLPHNEVVLNDATYKNVFDESPQPNAFLVKLNEGTTVADLRSQLNDVNGFERVIAEKEQQLATYNSLSSVTYSVVLIYLALSALMAIVVLLNLNVMFIEEKKRELIVLMINGFSVHDAKRYIYNDTILLTIIGIIVGLILGTILGGISVQSIESDAMFFYSGIDWFAILIGVLTSAILAFIMSAIALRRIPRFNLTDINKL